MRPHLLGEPARQRSRRRTLIGAAAALVALATVAGACSVGSPSAAPPTSVDPSNGEAPISVPTPTSWLTVGSRPGVGSCPLFPEDHAYHATISSLPVHPRSAEMIRATAGSERPLGIGFSSGIWEGSRLGIPFNVVDGNTAATVDFTVTLHPQDPAAEVGVPMPENPRFEGWPGKAWDRHLVIVDTATCQSRELLNVRTPEDDMFGLGGGRWYADSAAIADLSSNDRMRGAATASGVSLLAGLVRFDEVASGEMDHAVSASLHQISAGEHVWPAMATDGRSELPDSIPMGSWLRLRHDVDLSGLGPQARVIAEAMQQHGVIISDSGPGFGLSGDPDPRWDDADLATLRSLTLQNFDIVDASGMMVAPDSFQLRR